MTKFSVFFLLAASAFAQKQPITLETLNSAGRGGGRGGAGSRGSPRGLRTASTSSSARARSLMVYDPATKTSKLLIDTTPIDAAADECAARRRSHGLDQPARPRRRHAVLRRRQDAALQRRRRSLPDPHRYCQVGATDQDAGPGTGRQALARRPMVAFRRGWDLYTVDVDLRQGDAPHKRRHRDAAQRHSRLGLSRGTDAGHRLLVVARFEVDLLPAVRFQPRAGVSARRHARERAPSPSPSAIRRPARTIPTSTWA